MSAEGQPPDPRVAREQLFEVAHQEVFDLSGGRDRKYVLRNIITGESVFFDPEPQVKLHFAGHRAYVEVGNKSQWVAAMFQWSVWEMRSNQRRFAYRPQHGAWQAKWLEEIKSEYVQHYLDLGKLGHERDSHGTATAFCFSIEQGVTKSRLFWSMGALVGAVGIDDAPKYVSKRLSSSWAQMLRGYGFSDEHIRYGSDCQKREAANIFCTALSTPALPAWMSKWCGAMVGQRAENAKQVFASIMKKLSPENLDMSISGFANDAQSRFIVAGAEVDICALFRTKVSPAPELGRHFRGHTFRGEFPPPPIRHERGPNSPRAVGSPKCLHHLGADEGLPRLAQELEAGVARDGEDEHVHACAGVLDRIRCHRRPIYGVDNSGYAPIASISPRFATKRANFVTSHAFPQVSTLFWGR